MSTSTQDVAAVMNAHLKQFSNFQTIKRVFSSWKSFHFETKQRIAKIITAMDFHELKLQTYYFNIWIIFVKAAKEEKANTFREILLARRVIRKWQELIQRNNKIILKKTFESLKDYLRREQIGKDINLGYKRRLLSGCIWRMKEYSIWRFERETRLHEKSILMHKRNLKYRFFQLLKQSAKITRDVEFMRSTALESRRFFLFKRFFTSWKGFAKTNKQSRINELILSRKTQNMKKKFVFYTWIQASVIAFQVRCFRQRSLVRKSLKVLAEYAHKKAARKKQEEFAVKKRIMGLKKMILLQWNYYANQKQTNKKRCEAYCQKRKTLKLEKAFSAFKKVCFKNLSEQRLMYLAMRHYQLKILGAYFGSWAGYLEQTQKEYLNMLTAERHHTKMLQRMYFKTLKSYILHRKILKNNGTVIKLNVEQKRKIKAFGELKKAWENELQIFNRAAWMNRIKMQANCFNTWRNYSRRNAYRKKCIKWSTDRIKTALLLRIIAGWARRSNQRRLIRYQNKDAKLFQRQLLERKGFLKLQKNWIQSKYSKIIKARREMRVTKTIFNIWVQEKNNQELVNRHIIERMLSKQCMAFFWLKGQAMKKKQYKQAIGRMNQKREERMKQITWRIWQLFLRIKGEKELYRLSLLKYWLTKKAKVMLKHWSQFTEKRKQENILKVQIEGKRDMFYKKWLLRELQEQSAEKLLMLRRTQRLRKRWDFKRSRVFFVSWAMKAEQNRTVRHLVKFSLEQRAWRLAQSVLIEWTLVAQKNKRNRMKVEEHISFKECVKISLVLKSWRRLARILAKEHKKTKWIAQNYKLSMLSNAFVGWSEAYRDKRFHEQNQKAEEFLMKRLAFMRVIFQLKQFSERNQKKRRIESTAMAHLINKQYENGWTALNMNLINQKRKKNLLAMSQIVEKALLFRRIISRMKVAGVLEKVKKVTCKFAAERLLRKSFKSLQENQLQSQTKERYIGLFREKRQKQIKLLVLQLLQENLDNQIALRGRTKQLMKKKQFKIKQQCFTGLKKETMKYRRVRLLQKELNRNKLARLFQAMKERKQLVALKKMQKSMADQKFKQQRLKSILKHWNMAIHQDKMDILTSNNAFRYQVHSLLVKAFQGLSYNQSYRIAKESNMIKAITTRCNNLKAYVFKAMRMSHLETLKVNLIKKKSNTLSQLICLKKWKKQLYKQTHTTPAILTISRVCSNRLKRLAIQAIVRRSQFANKLNNLSVIYTKQTKVSFLKVFFDNAARQIKIEQFKENKVLTSMHQAFYVLSQYAAFKRQRHVRIATVLQAINSAQAVNLAQSAFAAWKRLRFLAILKRSTVIRYANHLKFISLFALRKLLDRMRKKKVIIEMREHHQKRLCLGEWKRLFLSGESTAPRHGRQNNYQYSSLDSPIQQHRYTDDRFKQGNDLTQQNQLREVDSQSFYPSQYTSKYFQQMQSINQFPGGGTAASAYSSLDIAPGRSQMLKSLDSYNYNPNNTFQHNYNSQMNQINQGYNSEQAQQHEDNTFVTENRISVTPTRSQLTHQQYPLQLQHHQVYQQQQQQQPHYFQQSTSMLSDLSAGLGQNQLFSSIPIPPQSLIAQQNIIPPQHQQQQQQQILPDSSKQHAQFVSLLTPSINLSYDRPNLPMNLDTNFGLNYTSNNFGNTNNQINLQSVNNNNNNKQNNYLSGNNNTNNNTVSSSSNSNKNYGSNISNLGIIGNQLNYGVVGTVAGATTSLTSNIPTNSQGNISNLHSIMASPYNANNNSSSLNQSAAGVNRSLPYDQQLPISDRNPIITSAAFNEIPFRPASLPQISPRIPTFSETKDGLDIHGQQQEFEEQEDDVNQMSNLPNSFNNSTGIQQRPFAGGVGIGEKKYQAFELENIEENNEENNSQSIVNKSQNEPSRKGSIHKSGKHGTNKSFEDYSNSKRQHQDQQQQYQQSYDYYKNFDPNLPVFSDKKQPQQQQFSQRASLSQQLLQQTPQQNKAFVRESLDAYNNYNDASGLESQDTAQKQRNLTGNKPLTYASLSHQQQEKQQQQ